MALSHKQVMHSASRLTASRRASCSVVARPSLVARTRVMALRASAEPTVAAAVNDDNFDEVVLKSKLPVLVDFWAPWCGPCRMIAPLVDELAAEYAGKFVCVKINTDESPGVATEYGIRSIPTCLFFVNGQMMETVIGAVPKSTLVATMQKFLP